MCANLIKKSICNLDKQTNKHCYYGIETDTSRKPPCIHSFNPKQDV